MRRLAKSLGRVAAFSAPVMPRIRDGLVLRPVALIRAARGKGIPHAPGSR